MWLTNRSVAIALLILLAVCSLLAFFSFNQR